MPAVFTFTEAGGHLHNEDSFGGRPHFDEERVLVFAIADGMGGQPKGGPAAQLRAVHGGCSTELELASRFGGLAKQLAENEAKINAELIAAQGKPVDMGGYYQPDREKTSQAMRPSPTLNAIIDGMA